MAPVQARSPVADCDTLPAERDAGASPAGDNGPAEPCDDGPLTAAHIAAALNASVPEPSATRAAAPTAPAPGRTPATPAPVRAAATPPAAVATAAVAARQHAAPLRPTLLQHVEAVRAECQRQRRRNCDAVAEAAAAEYDTAWQAQSASRAVRRP